MSLPTIQSTAKAVVDAYRDYERAICDFQKHGGGRDGSFHGVGASDLVTIATARAHSAVNSDHYNAVQSELETVRIYGQSVEEIAKGEAEKNRQIELIKTVFRELMAGERK